MKPVFITLYLCAFLMTSCVHSADHPRRFYQSAPQNPNTLAPGTYDGCVLVPATDFVQRLMVGFALTGETCSVTVGPNNSIRVDFLGGVEIPLRSTSTERAQTDTFVGELGNDQALIVQHHQGRVVSVTQTIRDGAGGVVYGKSGRGDYIKACDLNMSTAERIAGRKICQKR